MDLPLAANVGAPVMRRCDGAHVRLQMLCREPCCVAIVSGTYGLVVLVCVCVHFLCFLCEDLYQGCEVMAVFAARGLIRANSNENRTDFIQGIPRC